MKNKKEDTAYSLLITFYFVLTTLFVGLIAAFISQYWSW